MVTGHCGICAFWEVKIAKGGAALTSPGGETEGVCKSNPPVPFLMPTGVPGSFGVVTQFPLPHSKMWCGKFEPRLAQ